MEDEQFRQSNNKWDVTKKKKEITKKNTNSRWEKVKT